MEPKAFSLFRAGRSTIEAVIALGIPAEWAEKMHNNFLRLQDYDNKVKTSKEEHDIILEQLPVMRTELEGILTERESSKREAEELKFKNTAESDSLSRKKEEYKKYENLIQEIRSKPEFEVFTKYFRESSKLILETFRVGEYALIGAIQAIKNNPERVAIFQGNYPWLGYTTSLDLLVGGPEESQMAKEISAEISEFFLRWMLSEYLSKAPKTVRDSEGPSTQLASTEKSQEEILRSN
jgi:hypothetical protein